LAVQSERFEDARRWYEILEQLPGTLPRNERLRILNNLAYASVELGDLTKAEQYVDQADKLAGSKAWAGMDYFLGTRGALRLAQGRLKEARDDLTHKLTLRGPDDWTLTLLARAAYQEGAFADASGYLDQIQAEPEGVRSRKELAEILERMADIDQESGWTVDADARRKRAKILGQGRPPVAALSDDALLAAAQSNLAGRNFTGLSTVGGLVLAAYISGFLLLAASIFLVESPPAGVVLLQAVLLMIFIFVSAPFMRSLMGPKKISRQAPAA